jgi:hypothetical protein
MNIGFNIEKSVDDISRRAQPLLLAALFLLTTVAAYCEPVRMAPPLYPPSDNGLYTAGSTNVFNWAEVPENETVTITRGTFDQGGYQLFDTSGETIIVPFTNHNLYVMKFACSHNGKMYFVNDGNAPVLYVPQNGYLDNATVPGAKWYPFSRTFNPTRPVYLGMAPSWGAFNGMSWYRGMTCVGGYYSNASYDNGGMFIAAIGLAFIIGHDHYYGWAPYRDYCYHHPAPYRPGYNDRDDYQWRDRPNYNHNEDESSNGSHNGYGGDPREYRGTSNHGGDHGPFHGGDRDFHGDNHSFNGGDHNTNNDSRHFNGGDHRTSGGDHSANGGSHDINSDNHSFNGGDHNTNRADHWFNGADSNSSGGNHSFSGGDRNTNLGDHSINGRSHDTNSGNHSFNGGDQAVHGTDGSTATERLRSSNRADSVAPDRATGIDTMADHSPNHSDSGGIGRDRSFGNGGGYGHGSYRNGR